MTTILGCIELLERRVIADDRTGSLFEAIRRGAQLTQSLLAFSRQQPLRPEPVDANGLLQETAMLIRRAVGETVAVELGFEPQLARCRADAAQLQAAVLNLVINARDAMPNGGVLSVRTADATLGPKDLADNQEATLGRFIALTVRDTGCGMTSDVLARAFEPFYTTKAVGQGTGLGLSQVFGFARQSGRHVSLTSTPGGGTNVTIYIPVVEEQPAIQPDALPGADVVSVASATVLMVEDETPVLEATAEALRDAGWRVLTARDGVAALRILEGDEAIDVLFSDIVMPGGIGGAELARLARRLRPGIGVLLASGYSGMRQEATRDDPDLLLKPYYPEELLARLGRAVAGMKGMTTAA